MPPSDYDPAKKYALVMAKHADLTARAATTSSRRCSVTAAAKAFALAKYPAIDPAKVTISK